MMQHDDSFEDTIAVFALGALPESQARDVAEHIASCASCRAMYRDLRETADLVGYAAETPVADVDELAAARRKAKIMQLVRGDAGITAVPSVRHLDAPLTGRRDRAWIPYLATAAAVVLAVGATWQVSSLRAQNREIGDRLAAAEARDRADRQLAASAASSARDLQARLAAIAAPGSKHYDVPQGVVVASNGRVVMALHLTPLPKGKVYQAWTLAVGAKAVAPSVTFAPGPGGVTVITLPESAHGLAAVALSVEPVGGSKAPTTTPAFIRPLG